MESLTKDFNFQLFPGYPHLNTIIFVHSLSYLLSVHANAQRVRRSSLNSTEKNHENGFQNQGTSNLQQTAPVTFTGPLISDPHEVELKRRHLHLIFAQQEAKCLEEFGELEPVLSLEFPQDLFQPFVCLPASQNFSACEQCIQNVGVSKGENSVDFQAVTTSEKDRHSNFTLTTNVFCESVTNSVLTTSPKTQTKETNYRHFVYLKSLFSGGAGVDEQVPLVFVVEQRKSTQTSQRDDIREGQWTGWRVLGKSPYGFEKIQVEYRQETYQWRVTAVGVHGPLAVSIVNSFETLDGYAEPGPPRRVFVIENKTMDSTVDVLLGWDPPQERACFYKIVLEVRNNEEPARTNSYQRRAHQVWFRDLKFDSTYEVRITSRSAEWHEDESTHASLSFTTPACLDAHQFRFDKCAPPAPRNLSFSVKAAAKVLDVEGNPVNSLKKHFTAQVAWKPPVYANGSNTVDKYVVDIGAFSWNARRSNSNGSKPQERSSSQLIEPQYLLTPRQLHLPGNVTHVLLDNLDGSAEYTVLVTAVSSKGPSPPATLTIKLIDTDVVSVKTTTSFWVYPWGILLTVLLVASCCHAVKRINRRRQIKAARDSYFKSIDQRDAFTADWSVVSLTEDPNRTWKVLEGEYFPRDKWHVGLEDLNIGVIIGKGEFGVVREAKIKRGKYFELLKRRDDSKTKDDQFQVSSTKLGNDETAMMETVAIKMLRVCATKADREDLRTELLTMQGLGVHPQIVTLLGVCTSPKSMCLVLEYCPGGDLLSFLRKFREKHLPMLNLRSRNMRGIWCENPEYKQNSDEDNVRSGCFNGTGNQVQQICYADLYHNEICSSNRELSDETQGAATQDAATETFPSSNEAEADECELISEKDVLSYARQIAVGMAYLERNHVIHRDLACRNILVMEDHKCVKISDFGLSRDIYTKNVYQQKTEGKLPFKWMALESITSRLFTTKSDVWSFGIVLWELVTLGGVPYPAVENQELLKLLRTGYRMERPDNCSEELYALMRKCWRPFQVDRPNFTELISYLETMMKTDPELYLTLQP